MILYYIRHAQSENNALGNEFAYRTSRKADPLLTGTGMSQAVLLGKYLANGSAAGGQNGSSSDKTGFGITHVYSSLMVRAVATGTEVAHCLGLQLTALEDLHECGGVYLDDIETGTRREMPGQPPRFYAEQYPDCILPEKMNPAGWWAGRRFETSAQCRLRAVRVINNILEWHAGEPHRVAVISHADFYNEFILSLLGIPRKSELWFTIHNTGITRVDFKGSDLRIVYMNRTSHLPAGLLTA